MLLNSNHSDNSLVKRVKEANDEGALSELISRHSGICHSIYHKYFSGNVGSDALDVKGNKDYLIYEAAKSFNPALGTKFSTWLGNIVTYACLNACARKKKYVPIEDNLLSMLVETEGIKYTQYDENHRDTINYIRDIIEMSGEDKAKEVIEMRYLSGDRKPKTFKNIADHFGVSTQTVVNWHDKFIHFLKNKLTSEETCDRI